MSVLQLIKKTVINVRIVSVMRDINWLIVMLRNSKLRANFEQNMGTTKFKASLQ
jgi:hypothetical protein